MVFWPERVFGLRVDLMGCRVIFLELLGVPEVQKNGIEGIDGLIDGDLKIVVLRSEGRIQYKYCIGSYFTNGDFWAMDMDTVILFESYILLSNLANVV